MAREIRHYRDEDYARIDAMRQEAFRHAMRPAAFARGGGRVLLEHGEIMAALLMEPFGQFFGGRSLRSTGITSVMVDPRARGRGLVSDLLAWTLREQRAAGLPLAMLYPSIISVYRKAGFEFAGATPSYRLPIDSLPAGGDVAAIEPWDDTQLEEIAACYHAFARSQNGMIERPLHWWNERVVDPVTMRAPYRYLVRRDGAVTGYVIYTQEPEPGFYGYGFSLAVRDMVWLDAHAAQALLAFLAANRPFGSHITWTGPVEEPLAAFLRYEEMQGVDRFLWVARLIDLPAALRARGYPPEVRATVRLQVHDQTLPENAGAWSLEVADGAGSLTRAQQAGATLDIGTLASLATGWLPAREAARTGRLHNATPAEIAALEAIFHGPKPWIAESF
ncbi:MAG: hypothetical protein DCC58_04610 [Chloroflexi bacterium]|nr:MAG: hypothetical protein DCC58_04610 [Chloroflexota bacterium]